MILFQCIQQTNHNYNHIGVEYIHLRNNKTSDELTVMPSKRPSLYDCV